MDEEKERDERKGSADIVEEKRMTAGDGKGKFMVPSVFVFHSSRLHILYTSRGNGMAGSGKGRVSSKFDGKRT